MAKSEKANGVKERAGMPWVRKGKSSSGPLALSSNCDPIVNVP